MTDQTMKKQPSIGVVLRAYNNDLVGEQIRKLNQTGMVDRIVVVTHLGQDKNGHTQNLVASIVQEAQANGTPIPEIQLVGLTDYTWSNALNAGVSSLLESGHPVDRVWCLSNEVDFKDRAGIESLLEACEQPNASCGFMLYKGRQERSYQLPRNTCTMWNAEHLRAYHREAGHYFDPITDKKGGMEDVLTALRLFARVLSFGRPCVPYVARKRAEISVPTGEKFDRKMKAENEALDFIYSGFGEKIVQSFSWTIGENDLAFAPKPERAKRIRGLDARPNI